MYGPRRTPRLLRGFEVLGRVWDGEIVRDGLHPSTSPPLFPPVAEFTPVGHAKPRQLDPLRPLKAIEAWQHQQVLVLRKNASYVW